MTTVLVSRPAPAVTLLELHRPAARNALNGELWLDLARALREADEDDSVRCVVVTGNDKAFSAGADLKEMADGPLPPFVAPERIESRRAVARFSKPLIAAVNGYALGAGCELMLACDLVVAGHGAVIGVPEVRVGNFPGGGGTHLLPRVIGKTRAMMMILTGEPVDPRTALDWGLINQVVEPADVVPRALALARGIAAHSPLAVRLAKQDVLASAVDPEAVPRALERKMILWQSADRRRGVEGFIARRGAADEAKG